MTKLAPEWVRTNDPVIRSPARYRWTTAPASLYAMNNFLYHGIQKAVHPFRLKHFEHLLLGSGGNHNLRPPHLYRVLIFAVIMCNEVGIIIVVCCLILCRPILYIVITHNIVLLSSFYFIHVYGCLYPNKISIRYIKAILNHNALSMIKIIILILLIYIIMFTR